MHKHAWSSSDCCTKLKQKTTIKTVFSLTHCLHPWLPEWASAKKTIHSLILCLCNYYATSIINFLYFLFLPSVLWCCWLGGRKGIRLAKKLSSGVLACIWPSWCHCHSLSLASVKSRLVSPFWYRPTRVVLEKGPLNVCACMHVYMTLLLNCVAQTNTNLLELELNDFETPVSRTVYLNSVANS